MIGLLAGLWGYLGVYRSRPASGGQLLIAAVIAAAIVILVAYPIFNNPAYTGPEHRRLSGLGVHRRGRNRSRRGESWSPVSSTCAAIIAGLWVAIAGVVTGIVAAIVSAPISAIAFGGVTGSGTDLIVAALRQGGSDVLQASLGQGLFSDPVDKLITSFIVFIILSNLSSRYIARFPLGERLLRQPAGSAYVGAAPATPVVDSEDQT